MNFRVQPTFDVAPQDSGFALVDHADFGWIDGDLNWFLPKWISSFPLNLWNVSVVPGRVHFDFGSGNELIVSVAAALIFACVTLLKEIRLF